MHPIKPAGFKASSLDIAVTQSGSNGLYTVSGKDAPTLYDKLKQVPENVRDLVVGELKDGTFTLEKVNASYADNAPTSTATAG